MEQDPRLQKIMWIWIHGLTRPQSAHLCLCSASDSAWIHCRSNTGVDAATKCSTDLWAGLWILAKPLRNASHDTASTISSARWFQTSSVIGRLFVIGNFHKIYAIRRFFYYSCMRSFSSYLVYNFSVLWTQTGPVGEGDHPLPTS